MVSSSPVPSSYPNIPAQGNSTPNANGYNPYFPQGPGNYANTPLLDAQYKNFMGRIINGTLQGNLTPTEDNLLGQELGQFDQNWGADESQGMNNQDRQQLWNEASQINQSIFNLRHNDLGTMGPGGPNAQAPLTFLQDVQQGKPIPGQPQFPWEPQPQPQPFPIGGGSIPWGPQPQPQPFPWQPQPQPFPIGGGSIPWGPQPQPWQPQPQPFPIGGGSIPWGPQPQPWQPQPQPFPIGGGSIPFGPQPQPFPFQPFPIGGGSIPFGPQPQPFPFQPQPIAVDPPIISFPISQPGQPQANPAQSFQLS